MTVKSTTTVTLTVGELFAAAERHVRWVAAEDSPLKDGYPAGRRFVENDGDPDAVAVELVYTVDQ